MRIIFEAISRRSTSMLFGHFETCLNNTYPGRQIYSCLNCWSRFKLIKPGGVKDLRGLTNAAADQGTGACICFFPLSTTAALWLSKSRTPFTICHASVILPSSVDKPFNSFFVTTMRCIKIQMGTEEHAWRSRIFLLASQFSLVLLRTPKLQSLLHEAALPSHRNLERLPSWERLASFCTTARLKQGNPLHQLAYEKVSCT